MVKLIIQIPCHNEADTLPVTLGELPRSLPGVDEVEWLVVDDGSTDGTADVAKSHGVDHVVRLPRHQGLARVFEKGLEVSLEAGADIIVNTDADNQYCADDIPKLIEPILSGQAELVVGERPISQDTQFAGSRRGLQKLGSAVVRRVSDTDVPDAPSGFRAMSREAAMRLRVFNEYSYTLETLIQAGIKGMAVATVPVRVNRKLRPSRLFKSQSQYIRRQALVIVRIFMTYRPFRFFAVPGALLFLAGFVLGLRFLYFYLSGAGSGHIQSVILAALLMTMGSSLVVVGFLADLISVNRKLLERLDWKLQRFEQRLEQRKGDG